jgi:ABC-2 type transport system ATP-binding protein
MIKAENLVKTYKRGSVKALDGLSLEVKAGTVLGVLGPNGAGKTTCVRVLSTLIAPDSGLATVDGIDVVKDPEAVRKIIGLSGQYAAVDETLTGWDNLVMFGRLYQLKKSEAVSRAEDLLEQFRLTEAAKRPIKTYSGGMRRRLDLAASLIVRPKVLFLDEPTTGLDPRGRLEMWEVIETLVSEGTTLLLTTQYLEEADQLADDIVVIDQGRVIAQGTSSQLKDQVGGNRLEVAVAASDFAAAREIMARMGGSETPYVDEVLHQISVPVREGSKELTEAVRLFDTAGIAILDLALKRPSLDDVFLKLTGHVAEDTTVKTESEVR